MCRWWKNRGDKKTELSERLLQMLVIVKRDPELHRRRTADENILYLCPVQGVARLLKARKRESKGAREQGHVLLCLEEKSGPPSWSRTLLQHVFSPWGYPHIFSYGWGHFLGY